MTNTVPAAGPALGRAISDSGAQALKDLAEMHLATVLERLPCDHLNRFALFIEVVRTMDYWGTHSQAAIRDNEQMAHSFDLMYWGWNRAVAELFEPLEQANAFPLMESTQHSREFAAQLMQEFGKVSLLYRLADMVERRIMELIREDNEFRLRMSEDTRAQFADAAESDRLTAVKMHFSSSTAEWTKASMRDAVRFPDMPGNYMAWADAPLRRWLRPDIEQLIKPLVRPWNTGHGVMVAYDARIEVDKHYLAEALALATVFREESGIYPDAKLGSITGGDVAGVAAALMSLHAKHFGCVLVAKKQFSQVSVPQSLPIWGPRHELEESIALMSGRSKPVVHAVFNALAMTSDLAKKLAAHSTPMIPLLFDLGNGLILRPVSSLTRNPLTAAATQFQWLDARAKNAIGAHREEWMRDQLYGMFRGNRYIRFPSNLKLHRAGLVLTDIDAIVYDKLTGDIGLFQLKWQNYSSNDVRQLRSKASNLSAELMEWSSKVKLWIDENGISALDQSLRLRKKRRETVKQVFLFAISKSAVRTQGYGIKTDAPDLAMAVWPQFVRVRMEVGPSERTLRDIHAQLLEEHEPVPDLQPEPAFLRVAGATLHIHDLWNRRQT
jgi:hypothetical protein